MDGKGVCIQVGLRDVAEYIYLVDDDWRKSLSEVSDPLKRVPEDIDVDSWRFIGVDSCGYSIHEMITKHGVENPDVAWVLGFLKAGHSRLTRAQSHMIHGSEAGWAAYQMPSISLQNLVADLGLTRIDVLALDIEGMEQDLLRGYDWRIKPDFMAIECHYDKERTEQFITEIENQGYKAVLVEPSNYDSTWDCYHNVEVHFRCTTW